MDFNGSYGKACGFAQKNPLQLSIWRFVKGSPVILIDPSGDPIKTIVEASGRIVDFPGIEPWTGKEVQHLIGNGPEHFVSRGASFDRHEGDRLTMYWTVQYDGRYWADEDGFGMTDDVETVLFARIDGSGAFREPFRLYRRGVLYYYYGEHSESPRPYFAYEEKYAPANDKTISIARGCDDQEVVVVPERIEGNKVTEIQIAAFLSCGNIRRIVLPDTVEYIGTQAFDGCEALESIRMPAEMHQRILSKDMFMNCSSLTRLAIPEGVQGIGREAFSGCSGLEEIILPRSVRFYGPSFIRGCDSLKRITMPAGMELVTPFSFTGSPLSDRTKEIMSCAISGQAYHFDRSLCQGAADASAGSGPLREDSSVQTEYALGQGFVLDNRDGRLSPVAGKSGYGCHVFQDAESGDMLTLVEMAVDVHDRTDEMLVTVARNRLKEIDLLYISWGDRIEAINGITYGTCKATISRGVSFDTVVAACGGAVLFAVGKQEDVIQRLRPVGKQRF